ncbi:MAG: D-tyrosyl-tRNA(Tyr) deacylase [Candidatus Omnitrophica bacterium]|nr:D-tyrosyl-tRNA(Tyr) deacylase [Candidatus Omnitrophota bacterium]
MKAVLQRVKEAKVVVAGEVIGKIGRGVLVFVGVEKGDVLANAEAMVKKITQLRIFPGPAGERMDRAAFEVDAEYLLVSQFTLAADLQKGNRPSFDNAASPEEAEVLYNTFVDLMKKGPCRVATGKFRAMMEVSLVNDGPVTFVL